jgi:hypothetical protein
VGARRAAAAASKLTANGTSAASQRDFILAYLVLGDFSTWNVRRGAGSLRCQRTAPRARHSAIGSSVAARWSPDAL